MWSLTWFLALITVAVTFIGCYRFTNFFHQNSTVYPTLIATGVTLGYLIFLPYLMFIIGTLALLLPIIYLWQRYTGNPLDQINNVQDKLRDIREKLEKRQKT